MNSFELTNCASLARTMSMQGIHGRKQRSTRRRVLALAMVVGGAVALSGCVSVNAPDKPIVIELNISIKQEVVYRLAGDAAQTVESHPDVF